MILYPAIDMKDGKCVRLKQGKFDEVTVFEEDTLKVAKKWETLGAQFIHLVDLDGALLGASKNHEKILAIAQEVSVPVQVGGGIRTIETVEAYIDGGVSRVILGTAAVKDQAFVKQAVQRYGKKVAVGIDAKDGFVATDGWEQVSENTAVSLAHKMERIGVETIIYTDIATDGMLKGPNVAAMAEMAKSVAVNIIASGGVTTVEDIVRLKEAGLSGAIIGRALYTGHIDLKEALEAAKEAVKC